MRRLMHLVAGVLVTFDSCMMRGTRDKLRTRQQVAHFVQLLQRAL